jgi:hypothetical protein
MVKDINIGDRVRFNGAAVEDVRGKVGVINKFLGTERLSLARLEQGKTIYNGLYIDVNMWEVRLDKSDKVYPSPEEWLDKLS